MMDTNEKLKQGRLAALHVAIWGIVLSIFAAICIGLFFAESEEPLLRRAHFAIAGFGIAFTGVIVYRILTGDISEHHYRERLHAEKEAERMEAEIAELNARAALARAKERAQYTPLPGRVAPRLPERTEPAMYRNGERVGDAIEEPEDDSPIDEPNASPSAALVQTAPNQWRFVERSAPADEPSPGVSARGQVVITESADAYNLRMRRLAGEIYELCRDVNPATQDLILERIPRTKGGLLRSNDDITKALNLLAERGLIEHSRGQGIVRRWLINGKPAPLTPKRARIESNVRVEQ